MLPVAHKLFTGSGQRSGVASSKLVPSLRTAVPFVLPAVISKTQNTRCGRGMIVPVTVAANTPIVVSHNLGRFVQSFWPLNNGTGFLPKLAFGDPTDPGYVSSTTQQTLIADEDLTQCLILMF